MSEAGIEHEGIKRCSQSSKPAAGNTASFRMMYSRLARSPAMSARSCSLAKSLSAEVLDHKRGPKVIAFKKRRRKNSRRKRGYRDEITVLRITEILTDNAKPTIGPRPKREKVAPAPVEDGDDEAPKAAKKKAPAKKAVAKKAAAKPAAKKAPAKKAAAKGKTDKK
jgi:hypothetical protein